MHLSAVFLVEVVLHTGFTRGKVAVVLGLPRSQSCINKMGELDVHQDRRSGADR
jgi:hypothetical protein